MSKQLLSLFFFNYSGFWMTCQSVRWSTSWTKHVLKAEFIGKISQIFQDEVWTDYQWNFKTSSRWWKASLPADEMDSTRMTPGADSSSWGAADQEELSIRHQQGAVAIGPNCQVVKQRLRKTNVQRLWSRPVLQLHWSTEKVFIQ